MQENNDSLKNMAANAFNNFEVKPPEGLFDGIMDGLAKRRRKITILRYTSLAASILLLIGLGIGFLMISNNGDSKKQNAQQAEAQNETKTSGHVDSNDDYNIHIADKTTSAPSTTGANTGQKDLSGEKGTSGQSNESGKTNIAKSTGSHINALETPDNQTEFAQNETGTTETIIENLDYLPFPVSPELDFITAETPSLALKPEKLRPVEMIDELRLSPEQELMTPGTAKSDNWNLALAYGVTSGYDLSQGRDAMIKDNSRFEHDEFSAYLANETSYFEDVRNTIHDAPLSFGVVLDKRIAPRLSLEAGVTYTRLGFKVTTDVIGSVYSEFRNEIYYLGIPAGLKYNFIDRQRFDVYVLQWLVWEKGVAGRWNSETYKKGEVIDFQDRDHEIRGIQMSSITGLGAQVRIAGNFYLFAQGGVQVFFLSKTQPYNLRSTRTAWPSFQTGLRIGL